MSNILQMKNLFFQSIHPYKPFNTEKSETFIIGSIPPYRFCRTPKEIFCADVDWYYGSKDNYFWDIIRTACGNSEINLCTREERKEFLVQNSIGIFDMIEQCNRKNGGSSDSDLKDIELIDICEIINKNKNIKRLLFTSLFVFDLFKKATKISSKIEDRKHFQKIEVCNKELEILVLYSPSPSWSRGLKDIRDNIERNKIRIEQYGKIFEMQNLKNTKGFYV